MQLARKLGGEHLYVVRAVYSCLEQNSGKGENGKRAGENFSFLLGFHCQKGSIKKISWLMKGEISQAESCTAQRELIL